MNAIESYYGNRLNELKALAQRGDPWIFLCASSFIEYLARMTIGKETSAVEYKTFLTNFFFRVCPEYARFRYRSGKQDLADQMYHVLRCGIIHSFSVVADSSAMKRSGRNRSIVLAHRNSGRKHLDSFVNNRTRPPIDAAIFVAEDFVEDVGKVMQYIFAEARKTTQSSKLLRSNIRRWFDTHQPIGRKMMP